MGVLLAQTWKWYTFLLPTSSRQSLSPMSCLIVRGPWNTALGSEGRRGGVGDHRTTLSNEVLWKNGNSARFTVHSTQAHRAGTSPITALINLLPWVFTSIMGNSKSMHFKKTVGIKWVTLSRFVSFIITWHGELLSRGSVSLANSGHVRTFLAATPGEGA